MMNTLTEVAKVLKCDSLSNRPIGSFVVDSRNLKSSDLFFCLKGERSDGHKFLGDAAKMGAIAAVVESGFCGETHGLPILRVDDVLASLQYLARVKLQSLNIPKVVAITGSMGKTTTKDFLKILIDEDFRVTASPGNANSQIGLPLTLLNHVQGDEEVLILEMGMTHKGNIEQLVEIAPPDIALITCVDYVHAANFNSLEEIAEAKGEIFSHPKTKLGIFQDTCGNISIGHCEKRTFSLSSSDSFYRLKAKDEKIEVYENSQMKIQAKIPFFEEHHLSNLLAALSLGSALGASWSSMERAFSKLKLPEKRCEQIEKGGVLFVSDAYNANATSIQAALKMMPKLRRSGKVMAVLGEMCELGSFSEMCHQEVGKTALDTIDALYCIGEECQPMVEEWKKKKRPVFWEKSREHLFQRLRRDIEPGDVVLLKGKNTLKLWEFVEIE